MCLLGFTFWRIRFVINVGNYSKIYAKQGKKNSFSIGLDATRQMCWRLKSGWFYRTEHHEIYFEQGIALLDKLIWNLETYDIISVEQVYQCIFYRKQ
jgi:asparagine synthase (glutamine-hydrolysing)